MFNHNSFESICAVLSFRFMTVALIDSPIQKPVANKKAKMIEQKRKGRRQMSV